MRCLAVILATALAVPAAAQDIVPDTLDWRGYYPLQVGNEWHYTETAFITPIPSYHRFQIASDTLVGNSRYFLQEQEFFDAGFQLTRQTHTYLRYDSVGTVVGFGSIDDDTSSAYRDRWLDLPFKSNFGDTLGHAGDSTTVAGGFDSVVGVGGFSYKVRAVKGFGPYPGPWGVYLNYAFGIGMTGKDVFDGPTVTLGYAVIGGRVFGSPVVTVGTEDALETKEGRHGIIVVYPNPTRASTTIALDVPEMTSVQLDLLDILGRKIQTLYAGLYYPGRHTATIDASTLSSGVYFIRMRAGGRIETRSLTVAK